MAVAIDLKKMPKAAENCFITDTLRAVERFYENPENQKKFEEWRKNKCATQE